jgi:hypothetical protein
MYNWSVDEKAFKKADPEGYKIWRLEQMINFGLNGKKLNKKELKKYWDKLQIDPAKKRFLSFLLHGKTDSY